MSSRRVDRDEAAEIYRPDEEDARASRAFDLWLQLQAALVYEPERAVSLLAEDPHPGRALARCTLTSPLRPAALRGAREALCRYRVVGVPWPSPRYPDRLRALTDAPLMLLVRGDVSALQGDLVAIVGARAATVQGLEIARGLGRRIAEAGATVVSGLARGIDAAAHRGALEAGGRTVAVQACGPDQIYPAQHRRLASEIEGCGAIVCEFPVGTPPRAPHFPLRNRVISGLSKAVIVVEARERSGSLITAQHAADQGREVLAVPGPIHAPTSRGPNRLIRDGATPIIDLDEVGVPLGFAASGGGSAPIDSERGRAEDLAPQGREILETLARGGLQRDELARQMGRAPEQLDLDLVELQARGRIAVDRDGRLVRLAGIGSAGPVHD